MHMAGETDSALRVVTGHMLAPNSPSCAKCGAPPSEHEVRNHNAEWHDGDVYCTRCGAYVRAYDAG